MEPKEREEDKKIRAFLAIPLPEALHAPIGRFLHSIRKNLPNQELHWMRLENMHITLAFLGKIAIKDLLPLQKSIQEALQGFVPFSLEWQQLEWFPSKQNPKFLTIIPKESLVLEQLAGQLQEAASRFRENPEPHIFRAHLSLARQKTLHPATKSLSSIPLQNVPELTVDSIYLYQSLTDPLGPFYQPLQSFVLQGRNWKVP